MDSKKAETVAVLTGDVIGSTRETKGEAGDLLPALRQAAEAVSATLPDAGVSRIDVFRGDSWQTLVRQPEAALRASLLFRTYLLGGEGRSEPVWDTRIGIGLGPVEHINARRISQSRGKAFVVSGAALDRLGGSRRSLAIGPSSEGRTSDAEAVAALLDALIQKWTSKQAWAVHGALRQYIQEEIGGTFVPPVGQRTVADHLHRADWNAVEIALHWWKGWCG